jgi:hypothetical protein
VKIFLPVIATMVRTQREKNKGETGLHSPLKEGAIELLSPE